MIKFNKYYFLLAVSLLVVEVFIGVYVHDEIIRPFGGDFLVVVFLYCLLKSFADAPVLLSAACVLAFSFAVELSQYFHLAIFLGLANSKIAVLLLGTTFSVADLLMYTLGATFVVFVEWVRQTKFKAA